MQSQRGVTLIEMLVAVAIIGLITLVSVPALLTYYQSNKLKAAVREFQTDLRSARQRAVSKNRVTKFSFVAGDGSRMGYTIWDGSSTTLPTTWTRVTDKRSLSDIVVIEETTFTDVDTTPDGEADIIFRPNGSIDPRPTETVAGQQVCRAVLRIPNSKVAFNEYTVFFSESGSMNVRKSKY